MYTIGPTITMAPRNTTRNVRTSIGIHLIVVVDAKEMTANSVAVMTEV